MNSYTAGIIVIGDEILSGRTQDSNSNFIAKNLIKEGIKLEEIVVIKDNKKTIIDRVLDYSIKYSYVFKPYSLSTTPSLRSRT